MIRLFIPLLIATIVLIGLIVPAQRPSTRPCQAKTLVAVPDSKTAVNPFSGAPLPDIAYLASHSSVC